MNGFDPGDIQYYGGFRQSVLKLVKLLIRARAKSEPDFFTTEEYCRWGLPDITDDNWSAESLLKEAVGAHSHVRQTYIDSWGSGGIHPEEPFLDFRCAVIEFIYDDPSGVLAQLGNEDRFDWAGAFQWNLLPEIREGLDLLLREGVVQPGERSKCPVKMGDQRGSEVFVLGKLKSLTPARYKVVEAVVKVFPGTLHKDQLVRGSGHTDAVNILKTIAGLDDDWNSVIKLAGTTGGGYGLQSPSA